VSDARIHDLGYRRYDGPRLGPSAAVLSLARHTFGALIGRRRSVWAKILTVAVAGFAYAPALVFLGFILLVPRELSDAVMPGGEEFLGILALPVLLFVVLGSPVALCPDRRSRLLSLYLASPLSRDTYLLAKAAAVATFLAIVTIGPNLLLLLGSILLGVGPVGIGDTLVAVLRVLGAGAVLSLLFGGLSLALSALSDRRTAAAAAVALWLIGSGTVVRGVLVQRLQWPDAWGLLDVTSASSEAVLRIYGGPGDLDIGTPAVLLAALAWIGGTAAFTRWRYRALEVTR